ncbi:DinB family protein [Chloroflexota bacterium]
MGHLIDSAANNHRRFVEAQFKDDCDCSGYDQEGWVAAQDYQHAPWSDLLALWASYNRHLAHVVASIPEDILRQPQPNHTLDEIALHRTNSHTPATLEYLFHDYYRHLEDHVGQLLSACDL